MKLAFSTLGCPGWSWDEIFATAKDLGLDGIEVRGIENEMFAPDIKVFSPDNRTATMDKLSSAGMIIPILTSGACLGLKENTESYMAEARSYIELAGQLGVPFVRVMITPSPNTGPAVEMNQAKGLYNELCDYANDKGVKVLIETNGPLADSRKMAEFMKAANPQSAGVLWDIHHPYRFFGETPEVTYANIGEWIRHIHVKDSVMDKGNVVYRMMGYGDVPIFDALKLLHNKGYEGFVSLEWVKRWCPDLEEPGIVFSHFASYMGFLLNQI